MDEFTKAEVLGAVELAAREVATQAAFLDDPNVCGDKSMVSLLDRRARALRYAHDILTEWGWKP